MFNYDAAFSRNFGWVSRNEQQILKTKRVAIAGAGGVGGEHLVTLCRLGLQNFHISDFDTFEVHNFNRQAGAFMSTIDRPKCEVMEEVARDINPDAYVKSFPDGIFAHNVDEFLEGVDVYVDSLDFFALEARRIVFQKCQDKGIPIVTAAPLGMGTAFLCFMPGKMTFEEYFRFNDVVTDDPVETEDRQYVQFLIGLSPAMLQLPYLVEPNAADFSARKGPSTPMGVKFCAGIAETNVLKILLKRGKVITAPRGQHFDAYRNKYVKTWRPFGNRNPLQKLMFKIASSKLLENYPHYEPADGLCKIEKLFEYAKWAPSGDNTQPQRIETLADNECIIHGFDTRDDVVYDLEGNASSFSLGCFIATAKIAAGKLGCDLEYALVINRKGVKPGEESYDRYPTFHFKLIENSTAQEDPLHKSIFKRTVQRKSMGTAPLSDDEKRELAAVLPDGYEVIWKESAEDKKRMAKFVFKSGFTRLNMPEAFEVHGKIVEYSSYANDNSPLRNENDKYSKDKIPAKATGLDPVGIMMSKVTLSNQDVYNAIHAMKGTMLPRVQLDYLPSLNCSAHFLLTGPKEAQTLQEYLEAGEALQRFWLKATELQLGFQPQYTPIVFSEYLRRRIDFTESKSTLDNAAQVDSDFKALFGEEEVLKAVYMGRVGRSATPVSRSVRLSLEELRYVREPGDIDVSAYI